MKKEKLSEIIGHIDDSIIEEAATYKKKNRSTAVGKIGLVAACLALVIVTVISTDILKPQSHTASNTPEEATTTPEVIGPITVTPLTKEDGEIISRSYKFVLSESGAVIWPWEYKTEWEKFTSVTVNGTEYETRGMRISDRLVGDFIGTGNAVGFDIYTDTEYTAVYEAFAVNGVQSDCRIALKMADGYYIYSNRNTPPPISFGDLLDAYGLTETLTLSRFTENDGYTDIGSYVLNDGTDIMKHLTGFRDAKAVGEIDSFADKKYLSFTVTSEAIGVYKCALYITADGYIWTNLADYGYSFEIGTAAADEIISYAMANSSAAESEPYRYNLIGKVIEIGDGYVLIDDTEMCVDANDGRVFKVLTDDIRVRRCFEFGTDTPTVGSTAVIEFTEPIEVFEDNTVKNAVGAYSAILTDDGDTLILE